MNKTIIYFLRHGEVENPKKILYGRLSGFGLSQNGINRIQEVIQELKDKKIDYIYVSPLRRARQTAQIISETIKLQPKISRLLLETKLFHAGVSLEVFKKDLQPHMYDDKYVQLGQESIQSQGERMFRFVRLIQKLHAGKTVLTISHGDPIMILKAKLLGVPFTWEFKRANYLQTGYFLTLVCKDDKYSWKEK